MTGTTIPTLDGGEVEIVENENPASEAAANVIVADADDQLVEVRLTKEQVAQLYHRLGVVLEPGIEEQMKGVAAMRESARRHGIGGA